MTIDTGEFISLIEKLKADKKSLFLGYKGEKPRFSTFEDSLSVNCGFSASSSGFISPSVAVHAGPVIVVSSRSGISDTTTDFRRAISDHFGGEIFDISFDSENANYVTWNPLTICNTWDGAERMARAMINLGPELETSHLSEAKTINVFAAFLYIANFRGMSFRELKKQFATDSCEFFLSDAKAIREWTKSCKAQGVEAKSEVGFEGTSESFYALKTAFEELKNYRDYVVKKRTKGIQVEIAGTSEILGSIYVAFDKIKKTLKSIDAVDVDDAYQFDFHAFVRSHGTIYLDVARGSEPNPLVGAFLKEAMHQWSHASSIPHWSRTETLLVVLDETLELAPITNLPDRIGSLYKDAIQMITVLHSGFHAQQMWGSSVGTFFQNMSNHVFLPGYLDSGYFAKNKDMLVKSGVEESTKHGFFNPETGSAHILTFDNGAKIRDVTNPDIGQIVDKATIDLQLGL